MITVNIVNMNGMGSGAAEKEVHADGCSHRKPYSSTSTESFDASNLQDLAFEVGWLINNDFLGDRDPAYSELSYEEMEAYVRRIGIANLPYSVGFGNNVAIRMMPCLKKVLSSKKKSSSLRWDPSLGVDTVAGEYRAIGKHSNFTIIPEATADGDQGWGAMALHRRTGWRIVAKTVYATLIEAADWCERVDLGTLRDDEREVFSMKKAMKKTAGNIYSDVMKYFGGEAMRSFREYLQGSYGYGSSIDFDYQGLASAISAKVQQAQSLDEALLWLAAFVSNEDYGVWDQWDAYSGIINELSSMLHNDDPEDVVQDLMSETETIWSKHLRISSKKTAAGKYEELYGMSIEWRPYGAHDSQGYAQGLIGENGIFTYTIEPVTPGTFLFDISDSETNMTIQRSTVEFLGQGMTLADLHSENYARELYEEEHNTASRKKTAMDPVGKEDEDVDNDGDSDESDDYLENRRDTITDKVKSNRKKSNAEFSVWVDGYPGVDRVDYWTALNLKTEFEAEGHVVEIRQGDFVTNTNPAPQFGAPMTARKKTAGGSGYVPETKAEIYAAEMYGIDFGGRDGETEDETNFIENYANMVADGSEPSTSDIDDLASNFPTLRRRASKKKAGLYSPSENFKCMDCGTDEDQFQLMDEDEAEWSDVQCPKCNAVYSPGFSEYEEDYDGVEHLAKKKYKRNTSALYGNNELWL